MHLHPPRDVLARVLVAHLRPGEDSFARILAKRELFQLPVLDWLMRLVGMVAVDRRCADLHQIYNDAATRCLASSHSLLVHLVVGSPLATTHRELVNVTIGQGR